MTRIGRFVAGVGATVLGLAVTFGFFLATDAVSLHFMHYNFCRPHQTLTKKAGKPTTPAMAAGITKYPWSLTQLAELLD